MLGAIDPDAKHHDTHVFPKVHPVDHQRDHVQRTEWSGEQLGQRGFGRRDEPSGDGGLAYPGRDTRCA